MRWTLGFGLVFLVGPTSQPTRQPGGATAPRGGGVVQYIAPPSEEWNKTVVGDAATFTNGAKDGAIQIVMLPTNANVDPPVADQVAVAILKQASGTWQRTARRGLWS